MTRIRAELNKYGLQDKDKVASKAEKVATLLQVLQNTEKEENCLYAFVLMMLEFSTHELKLRFLTTLFGEMVWLEIVYVNIDNLLSRIIFYASKHGV